MDARYPTGRQLTIRGGEYCATITEVGGGLRTVTYAGVDIVDGFDAPEIVGGSRGQVLAPWPNRLRDGAWTWQGEKLQLPVDEPQKGNSASHGLVRWVAWIVQAEDNDRVVLGYRLHPQPGYPFALDLSIEYLIDPLTGLKVVLRATNIGCAIAPVALGMHPYLRSSGGGLIDGCKLRLPAHTRVLTDAWGSPVGEESVANTPYDFRESRVLSDLSINSAFTSLTPDASDRTTVELSDDCGTVELWVGPSARWIQVFTGDSLPADARRRGIAVEPMTAPANALASGEGIQNLEPGESLSLVWGLRASLRSHGV